MRVINGEHKRSFLASTGLAVILTTMASGAYAQQKAAASEADGVELKTITIQNPTAAKGDAPYSTPAAVSAVSKEEINRYGDVKLDDLLRDVPGTFTRINGQQPGVAVNIRGFEGSGRVNTMIDGVRQNFRFTGHEASGFTYVDSNLLADIDVSRGAVTGLGGGGLAGSVNLRTLGVDDIVRPGQQYGVLGRASWGSNGVGFSEMIAGGARVNSMGIAGAISHRDSDNYKNGDGVAQKNTGQKLTSGLIKTEFGFGEDHKLSLGGVLYNNDFGANSYNQTIKNRTLTANYSYNPADNDLIDFHLNGYYNRLDMNYFENLSGSWNATTSGREIRDTGLGFDISNTSRFNVNEIAVKWNYGVEYFRDKVTGEKTGVNPDNGRSTTGAVFSDTTLSYGIADLTVGLRYNFYSLEGDATDGTSLVDRSFNALDPRITLAVNATNWLQPYVTYSHSMRSPTLQETMVGGVHPGSTQISYRANPDLEPEKQRGWEIGANIRKDDLLTAGDSLRIKANYYDMDVENYIISSAYNGCNPLTDRTCQTWYTNVDGNSRVRGVELQAAYDAGFAFGGVTYTYTKANLPSILPGLGASQYLPDNIFSLSGGARFLERKLTVGGRYSYVSTGKVAGYTGTTTSDKSYGLVDVFANYKFTENVDLTLKVNNLFDKTYTPFLSTSGSGQGRTFLVATQFQF